MKDLLQRFKTLTNQKAELRSTISQIDDELKEISKQVLEEFSDKEITKVTDGEGATFYRHERTAAVIEDKGELFDWLADNGMQHMLTVNSQTLSALVKAEIENGKEIPSGVDINKIPSLRILGRTKKKGV